MYPLGPYLSGAFQHARAVTTTAFGAALVMLAAATSSVQGDILHWNGSQGLLWSAPGNWNEGRAPVDGDLLQFPAGAANPVNYNDLAGLNLESIYFGAGGYTLFGNGISLTDSILVTVPGVDCGIDLDLHLDDVLHLNVFQATSSLEIHGNIALGTHQLFTEGRGAITLSGVISGAGNLRKFDVGTLTLSGSEANEYTGDTFVQDGTLQLTKTVSDGAVPHGALRIGVTDGGSQSDTPVVVELTGYQIGTIPVIIQENGWLNLGDYQDTVGAIEFHGGRAGSSATGRLRLGGDVTAYVSTQEAVLDGNVYLGSGTRTFDVKNGAMAYDLRVNAVLGGGGLTKTGAGELALLADNTYDGETIVDEGVLYADHDEALGSTAGGTTVTGSGELNLYSTYVTNGEPLTLDRPNSSGDALVTGGVVYWLGPVTLMQHVGIRCDGSSLNFESVIGGTGGISLNGPGICRFYGTSPNTYTGDTVVNSGTLELSHSGYPAIPHGTLTIGNAVGPRDEVEVVESYDHQIGDTVAVTVNSDGGLRVYSHTDTVGALTFNGGHAGSSTGFLRLNGNVQVNASSTEALLDGKVYMGTVTRKFNVANGSKINDLRVEAVLSGSGLTKTGSGRMALLENNTYSGETLVSEGVLYGERDHAFGSAGGGTTVTGSGQLHVYNADIPSEALTLNKPDSSGNALVTSGSTLWNGPVTLVDHVGIDVQGSLNLDGVISGTGGLSLNGPGVCQFGGASANAYAGDTRVNNGTLVLNKTALDGALPGPGTLYVGDGASPAESILVKWQNNSQLDEDTTIHVIPGGKIDLNNHIETVGEVVLEAGRMDTGTGTMTLTGNVTAQPVPGAGNSRILGRLSLGSATRTFTVPVVFGADAVGLLVDADVIGTGGIMKAGTGGLGLRGDNTYGGLTTLTDGELMVLSDTALGESGQGTVVGADGVLSVGTALNHSVHVGAEPLTLYGALFAGALGSSTSNSWAGPITLASDTLVSVAPSVFLNLTGSIDGAGGWTKISYGTLILSGSTANTYAGATRVNSGTLELAKTRLDGAIPGPLVIGDGAGGAGADVVRLRQSNQIANTADVTIAGSGVFDLDGFYDRMNALTGSGSVALDSGHLIAGHNGSSFTFDGTVSGSGYLWKVGGGTWTLTADNGYAGTTRIEAGALMVHGSQPASDVLVESGGTLGGSGTVGDIASGGTVAPGPGAGRLQAGTIVLDPASTLAVKLNGHLAGSGYDQLSLRGTASLDGAMLDLSLGYLPAVGDRFVILDNDGGDPVTGTFGGLPDGHSLTVSNATLVIDYYGGDGNDIELTVSQVASNEELWIMSAEKVGDFVVLSWNGGVPLYTVEQTSDMTNDAWTPITAPMRGTQQSVPLGASSGIFRIRDGN